MPTDWNVALNDLIILLAGLYPDPNQARFAVRRSGLDPDEIDLAGTPKVFWMRIVEEANRRDNIPGLLVVAKDDSPNIDFGVLDQQLRRPTPPAVPRLSDDAWKGPATAVGVLEKII